MDKIIKDKSFYIFGIITLIFFGVFVIMQYAPDTYAVFSGTTKEVVQQFFSCGRFVTGIAAGVIKGILDFSPIWIYNLSYVFALLCTIISLYRLYLLINKDIKNKIICVILSTLVVINIFSFELFVYIEKGIMMFSVLMSILAVEQTQKLLEYKKIKYMIWAIIFMLIATCSYQGTVGIFVAISLIYILKYSKTIKEFLLNNIKVVLIYGIPAIINFILVRAISTNARVEGNIVIAESITKIIDGVKYLLIRTYDMFPKYAFVLTIFAVVLFSVYQIIRNKKQNLKILGIIYILAGTLFATIAPQILQNTDSIWFVARSTYPMASVIGILLIYILSNFQANKIEKNIIILFSCIYMLAQISYFIEFAVDGYIVNYQDKKQALEIINMINQYESQTGNQITKIAYYYDNSNSYGYPETKVSGDINIRGFSKDWVTQAILKYYLGRNLEIAESLDELKLYYKEKEWQEFDRNQITFKENTMHLCLY